MFEVEKEQLKKFGLSLKEEGYAVYFGKRSFLDNDFYLVVKKEKVGAHIGRENGKKILRVNSEEVLEDLYKAIQGEYRLFIGHALEHGKISKEKILEVKEGEGGTVEIKEIDKYDRFPFPKRKKSRGFGYLLGGGAAASASKLGENDEISNALAIIGFALVIYGLWETISYSIGYRFKQL